MRVTDSGVEKGGEDLFMFNPCNRAMRGCKCDRGRYTGDVSVRVRSEVK